MTELTPKRSSFIFARVSGAMIIATVLAVAFILAGLAAELYLLALLGVLLWGGLVGLSAISAVVAFRKERYEIHEQHLVAHLGGIFSDQTTELEGRNITHVQQRLPWIRYRFFNVGDVIVQSAGSSSAEVVFRSVRDPDAVYERIRSLLRSSGFSMRGEKILHHEQPSTTGVIVECISMALGAAVFSMWMLGGVIGAASTGGPAGLVAGALVVGVLVLGGAAFLVLHFLDMKRRTYEVYSDIVEYREGFLSRTNAFIPYENIADAATRQTFFDRILGLYDVTVSCQGSGSEVAFRRLADGPKLQSVLRGRVDAAQEKRAQLSAPPPDGPTDGDTPDGTAPQVSRSQRPHARPVPASQAWTAELRMHGPRAFLGGALLRAMGTTYTVGASSIASLYSLIGRQQQEFAYDKVTGVQVRVSPLDALFGTFTVRIWSIGSSTPLDLAHVRRADVDLPALLLQAGIPGGPARCTLPAAFGPLVWLRANVLTALVVPLMVLTSLALAVLHWPLALIAVALVGLVGMSFPLLLLRHRQQLLTLHDHHIEHRSGLLWRNHIYARYDDIKKLSVQRYAGTSQGRLTVFVAGETEIQTGKGKSGAIIPNAFTAHYLPDVSPLPHTLDRLLLGHIEPDAAITAAALAPTGREFRPAVANSVLSLLLFGLLFPPLWLLVPYAVLSVKRRTYRVEADRAVIEEGVIYRSHTAVLYDRIDSLNQGQGMLGKAFNNGTVTLFTAGSSRPDLVLSNTPEFKALYAAIRERYGGSGA